MYSYSIYIGLKVVPKKVHWGQSMSYLGTWTLREIEFEPRWVCFQGPGLTQCRAEEMLQKMLHKTARTTSAFEFSVHFP